MAGFVTRGFRGRRRQPDVAGRVPPGQSVTADFPVLSAGPTPRVALAAWDFGVGGEVGSAQRWSWEEFRALPSETITADIHCVTKWSKLDTVWEGVSLDAIWERVVPTGGYVVAHCDGGYTTNLPLEDVRGGKVWIAYAYAGEPLAPEHGGPARLLVPHLYLWKSAKWVRRLEVVADDRPGFWESLGYHHRGDPWLEERYHGD